MLFKTVWVFSYSDPLCPLPLSTQRKFLQSPPPSQLFFLLNIHRYTYEIKLTKMNSPTKVFYEMCKCANIISITKIRFSSTTVKWKCLRYIIFTFFVVNLFGAKINTHKYIGLLYMCTKSKIIKIKQICSKIVNPVKIYTRKVTTFTVLQSQPRR